MSSKNRYDNDRPEWIPYARQSIEESDVEAVVQTLRSNYITQGPRTSWFEEALKEATGASHAVVVSSGTAALHLSCLALDVSVNSVGIVPANTFVATANCLKLAGGGVIFADVDPTTGLSQPSHFKAALEESLSDSLPVKALLPVSYSGSCPDFEGIRDIADQSGLSVIHDASHSLGASYRTSDGSICKSGSCAHADAAIFSFHPVKSICAGEGGAILTNDEALARRARRLRSHGVERSQSISEQYGPWAYQQEELGLNYRMTEMQAALGYNQLARLGEFVDRRLEIARRYHEAFSVEPFARVFNLPQLDERSAWHLYPIRFRNPNCREQAYAFLKERNIGSQVHYIPLYHHSYYKDIIGREEMPGAEQFYASCLSIPLYPSLQDSEQERITSTLKSFCEQVD